MELEKKIKSEIFSNKKEIRLDYFINNVLFKKDGYYLNQRPVGKNYDFITSPEISQIFGEIIGLYFYYFWKNNIEKTFNLIELGPGNGTLFMDIAKVLENFPNFFNKAKISFIEKNKTLIKSQKKNIYQKYNFQISWLQNINFKSSKPSIIYSNEFFDCFPVRQFLLKKSWFEKYVNFDQLENRLYFTEKLIKNKKLLLLLSNYKDQKILELSNDRNKYFEKICKFIKKNGGLFFTIDYGYFKNINNFTLQAIQGHKFSHIFDSIGKTDISSHVNFADLLNIANDNNLKIEECCTQREFFIKYGILEREKNLPNSKNISKDVDRLINQNDMGSLFKCLIVSNF